MKKLSKKEKHELYLEAAKGEYSENLFSTTFLEKAYKNPYERNIVLPELQLFDVCLSEDEWRAAKMIRVNALCLCAAMCK